MNNILMKVETPGAGAVRVGGRLSVTQGPGGRSGKKVRIKIQINKKNVS